MEKIFEGVATALVTPFNGGKVDYAAFARLIERQVYMQADALVVLGTTGEISTLSDAERKKVIAFALKENKNRLPVIFGIGGNNPTDIIALGQYIGEIKKQNAYRSVGIMVTAPYYNKATQDGLVEFFKAITAAVKLPTIIYNIPARTGINIEPETLARIARLPYVAGIKEASGNLGQIADVNALCPNTAVYSGDDTLALPSYAVGCAGIISVASNVDVSPVKQIYSLYKSGKPAEALAVFGEQLPFYKSLFRSVNPIPVKHKLGEMGLIKNELRLPLTPL